MNRVPTVLILLLLFSGALGVGYWLGSHRDQITAAAVTANLTAAPPARAEERKVLYYQDPMGKPDYSPTPKKDSMGMDYIPVYEGEEDAAAAAGPKGVERTILYYRDPMGKPDYSPTPKKDSMGMDYIPVYEGEADTAASTTAADTASAPRQPSKSQGKILYYRNPMGLPDTSPTPKKDSMGMDYIPVYEGEEEDGSTVKVSPAKVQRLGVRTEAVAARDLTRTIRAVATVQPDERKLYTVTTKFEGYIDKLHVNATGQLVHRGEPLMEIYSPDLVAAQQEYLLAWRAIRDVEGASSEIRASAKQLADAALQRLRYWDISDDQLQRLRREGKFTRTLTLRAPAAGVVLEKNAVEGMRFMPGEALYKIADLSTIWLIADVFEQELGSVRVGQSARIAITAFPGDTFEGKVSFIYPTLARETRTGRVRIEIPNPDGRLRTDMYANVEIAAPLGAGQVVAVPDSAVINSGTRQAVLVDRGEGRFEPREVKLGARAGGYYEVRDGVKAGEKVVVSANFLIDAESNLKAAFKAFTPPDQQGSAK